MKNTTVLRNASMQAICIASDPPQFASSDTPDTKSKTKQNS